MGILKSLLIVYCIACVGFANAQIRPPDTPQPRTYAPQVPGQSYTAPAPTSYHNTNATQPANVHYRSSSAAKEYDNIRKEINADNAKRNIGKMDYHDPVAMAKDSNFNKAFDLLMGMLNSREYNFKKAVFITEKAYEPNLSYQTYNNDIGKLAAMCKALAKTNPKYETEKLLVASWAVKHLMVDTVSVIRNQHTYNEVRFNYDFNDMFGKDDTKQMFITKLMTTGKGNCHSFPYLYKILAGEMGIGDSAHLAYAPNHVFIRQKMDGMWWNLELTNGNFMQDWLMMATGYIHVPGIQGHIYMTPLNEQESIAACVMDLEQYYEDKYGLDNFTYKCTQLALEYYPNCIQAMLVQANYWNKATRYHMAKNHITDIEQARKVDATAYPLTQLEATMKKVDEKGYIEVPKWKYQEWIESMKQEQAKRAGFK